MEINQRDAQTILEAFEGEEETALLNNAAEEKGTDEIFPNGPTKAQIIEWKDLHGEIYSTMFGDDTYIWRCMVRTEYKEVLRVPKADAMYREEKICSKCVLWPEHYDQLVMSKGKAGVPAVLAEQIMERSGFVPNEEPRRL